MVEITKNGNVTVILFTNSDYYLFNSGQILAPLGSLTMVIDKSNMVTFRKAASNDLLFSAKISKVKINGTQLTKANAQTLFDAAMGGSNSSMRFEEVEELPETGENGVIYLVPNGDDTFTEWVWVENEETFEKLGYDVDLSDYYTKEEIDDAHLTISAALNELHDEKQNNLVYDNIPTENSSNSVTSGGIFNWVTSNYYNDQWVDMHLQALDYAKQDKLTFDSAPTQDSTNPVTSGGVYTALGNKQDSLVYDNIPTENSTNSVTSGGIFGWVEDNFYNNQWVDTHLQDLEEGINDVNQVVSTALNRLNSGKADKSTTYTKSEVDTLLSNKQGTLTFDSAPTQNSTNPVTSGGLYNVLGDISTALSTIIGNNS